jgi:hypothetical protein
MFEALSWRDRLSNEQVAEIAMALQAQARAKGGHTPFLADVENIAETLSLPVPAVAGGLMLLAEAGVIEADDPPPGENDGLLVHLLDVPPIDPILAAHVARHHARRNGLSYR